MCTECRRSTEVVRYHFRSVKTPISQERGQDTILNAKGYVLTFCLFRLSVTQEIENIDLVVSSEFPGNIPPNIGGKWRAVNEDNWIALTERVVCDRLPVVIEALAQAPFGCHHSHF